MTQQPGFFDERPLDIRTREKVLALALEYREANGRWPEVRTIADALGLRGGNTVSYHLQQLYALRRIDWRRRPMGTVDRFWSKVDKSGDCWIWRSQVRPDGYGRFYISHARGAKRSTASHRMSWELAHGSIPAGLQVCHRCDNPPCVNPAHLFLGTAKDNAADSMAKGRRPKPVSPMAGMTHCVRGHEFSPKNTRFQKYADGTVKRECRRCGIVRKKKWRQAHAH
jgi:hypothetical protein